MKVAKIIFIILMVMLFLLGLSSLLYPYVRKAVVDSELRVDAQAFIERITTEPSTDKNVPDMPTTEPTEPIYSELLCAMQAYNQQIWEEKQAGLCDPWSYQQPSFTLEEFGIIDETFGVISIPALDLSMPIYLGATSTHLSDGAAQLSQTSIPIGGINTNCVIAGHRGWYGASYFRYITDLQLGDQVIITNLWEELVYEVVGTQIIAPNEVDKILIQEGKDMVTLLTCHPYASGGKQRYLVFCERTNYEHDSEINHH